MRKILLLAIAASTIFGTGSSFANHEAGEEEHTIPASQYPQLGHNDIYIDEDEPALWEESNNCPGLQTAPYDCDHDEETPPNPPDTDLDESLGLPGLPEAPEVPEVPEVPLP